MVDQRMDKSEPSQAVAPPRRRSLFGRLARNRKGAVLVEFAMVAIPFLGLLCAIFETAFVFFTHEAFDNAVAGVARQVLTNQFASTSQTASSFLTTSFCPQLPSFINCSRVALNIQAFDPASNNFSAVASAINQNWWNAPSANVNLGLPGYIVVFQAFYPMPVYLSILVATGSQGKGVGNLYDHASNSVYANPYGAGFVHAIFSTAVFRNEP
jgi:Flp pilus assembly protein TadG